MTTDAALVRRLEDLGARPVPPRSRAATARLDDRIAVLTAMPVAPSRSADRTAGVVIQFPKRRGHRTRLIARAAGAVAVAAVIGAGVLAANPTRWFTPEPDPDLALAAARNATVRLPDGSSLTAHVGQPLPEGAIVTTGPGGYATAGGVEIGPGVEAVVSGGELEPAVTVPALRAPPPPTTPPPTVPSLPGTTPQTPPAPQLP